MHRHALVNKSGRVENVIVWDGDTDKWQPEADCSAVISNTLNIGDYILGYSPSAEELITLKSDKILAIKAAAQERIYGIAPAYLQLNLLARAAELNASRHERKLTVSESAEWAAIDAKWQQIKQIRQESNNAEAAVNAAKTIEEINAVTW